MWYIGETIVNKSNNIIKKLIPFYENVFFGKGTIVLWNKVNKLAHWFVIAPKHLCLCFKENQCGEIWRGSYFDAIGIWLPKSHATSQKKIHKCSQATQIETKICNWILWNTPKCF